MYAMQLTFSTLYREQVFILPTRSVVWMIPIQVVQKHAHALLQQSLSLPRGVLREAEVLRTEVDHGGAKHHGLRPGPEGAVGPARQLTGLVGLQLPLWRRLMFR